MKYFYLTMIAATQFELAIARTTGRNPDSIRQLRCDELKWIAAFQDWSLNRE